MRCVGVFTNNAPYVKVCVSSCFQWRVCVDESVGQVPREGLMRRERERECQGCEIFLFYFIFFIIFLTLIF